MVNETAKQIESYTYIVCITPPTARAVIHLHVYISNPSQLNLECFTYNLWTWICKYAEIQNYLINACHCQCLSLLVWACKIHVLGNNRGKAWVLRVVGKCHSWASLNKHFAEKAILRIIAKFFPNLQNLKWIIYPMSKGATNSLQMCVICHYFTA